MGDSVTVACVLRSGGEFRPEHVIALYEGVRKHWPGDGPFLDFACLTDTLIGRYGIREIPLIGRWPGWWSKMEVHRSDIPGTVLYLDLDTVIVGDLSGITGVRDLTLMRDVYRPDGLQASFMALPEGDRHAVWAEWIQDPAGIMAAHRSDQEYLETHWLDRAHRWQDALPGQVVSWKVDCQHGVPEDARVVIYHGRPRPWETELWAA